MRFFSLGTLVLGRVYRSPFSPLLRGQGFTSRVHKHRLTCHGLTSHVSRVELVSHGLASHGLKYHGFKSHGFKSHGISVLPRGALRFHTRISSEIMRCDQFQSMSLDFLFVRSVSKPTGTTVYPTVDLHKPLFAFAEGMGFENFVHCLLTTAR